MPWAPTTTTPPASPTPEKLNNIEFEQQTVIYDRTGKIELARLGDLKRELVTFDQLPGEIVDATTAIEDKDFWINPGFDPAGIVSAGLDTLAGRPRGASTITQQLVRARLLPPEAFEGSIYERKVREIIQSIRLTQAFPGEEGKKQIITAYLNQNFYGNQSYGVKAAAKSYFGKSLDDLTLAQDAILAAIPQSPTKFDLMRNANEVCLEDVAEGEECTKFKLVVPPDSEIVQRRNNVLDLMKTRSPLTGNKHTAAEYEIAKEEPVELKPPVAAQWKAPHFVWQVRRALGAMLCPDDPIDCPEVDTGGFKVITTIDLKMQKTAEKWVYVAARAPNAKNPSAILSSRKIPGSARSWILGLRGHNIHNAAAGVIDYRTGEVLAYAGSASYTSKGNKKFQPQFDVLADGWRQPGSAIKPIDYVIGIDDKTLTAATMFMDVTTNFGGGFTPTQADKLERGPVRLRSALQFSLNIPAIKATIMSGLDHVFERTKEFGLTYPKTALPVLSMGIGTLEVHPIDLLGAYGTIANGGVLHAAPGHQHDPRRRRHDVYWPTAKDTPKGTRVISAGAAYIVTDIMAGNTDKKVNPFWGKWAIYDKGRRAGRPPTRPARRTTTATWRPTATSRRRRTRRRPPSRSASGWATATTPQRRQALARHVGAALVGDPDRGHQGHEDRPVQAAEGCAQDRDRRRVHRPQARPVHEEDGQGILPARAPCRPRRRRSGVAAAIDAATGLLWQDGCAGTEGHARLLQPVRGREPTSRPGRRRTRLGRPGGPRLRRPRRPEGDADRLLLQRRLRPVRADLGRAVPAARRKCPLYTPPVFCDPFATPDPSRARRRPASRCPTDPGGGDPQDAAPEEHAEAALTGAGPTEAARPSELDDRRPVAALAALAGPHRLHQRVAAGRRADRVAQRAGPHPVDDQDLVEPGQAGVVEVAVERVERLVHPGPAQVERRRDRPRPIDAQLGRVRVRRRAAGAVPAGRGRRRRRPPGPGRRHRP